LHALRTALAATGAAAILLLAACADEENEPAAPTVAQPTATMEVGPPPTEVPADAVPTATAPAKPKPAPPPPSSGAPTCATGDAIGNLKFTGIGCEAAAAVTGEWERQINRCNTIDDPGSPEGFTRRCEIRGYECTAKRDTSSDARMVSCRGASSQIRFTWAP
jgi:hypothetical protein